MIVRKNSDGFRSFIFENGATESQQCVIMRRQKEKERHEQLLKEHEELMRMIDEARKGMHKND